jgi:hypothetical protein
MPEDVSVAPIDTMVVGMEKPLSGLFNYEPVVETHTRTDQGISQWPASLNPADFPLKFHQASIPLFVSGSDSEHMGHQLPQDGTESHRQQQKNSMQQNSSIESTDIAGKTGLNSRPVIEEQKKQQPVTSNAPQTKSQQQRLALKKFSRAVSDEMEDSSSPVDLEQAVLRILAGSNDSSEMDEQMETARGSTSCMQSRRTNKVFLTKSEAIKAAQAISNLIKQSPGSVYSQPRKVNQGFASNPKVCDRCGYAVARACDLKKHMKRHEKPYGCTYPKCHKRFGAKSDWKRHENSQHFQLEAFRCDQKSATGQICGEHFLRVEHFKKHLEAQHKVSGEQQVSEEVKRCRIGKNCQQRFWCGFHCGIVVLKEKRNAAWDERFDHIAHHFEKEKKSIEEWVCAEENKTKKELLKEMDRYVFDDENERGTGDIGVAANRGPPPSVPLSNQGPSSSARPSHEYDNPLKRGPATELVDARSHKKYAQGTEITRYCVCVTDLWQRLKLMLHSANATTVRIS